jgi:hypothetical protein
MTQLLNLYCGCTAGVFAVCTAQKELIWINSLMIEELTQTDMDVIVHIVMRSDLGFGRSTG